MRLHHVVEGDDAAPPAALSASLGLSHTMVTALILDHLEP